MRKNMMFRFKNLKTKLHNSYNLYNISTNTFQNLNLVKHDIYPHFNNAIKRETPTTLIVNSGKILVSLFDINTNKELSLFAEHNCLYQSYLHTTYNSNRNNHSNNNGNNDNKNAILNRDIVYTNQKYALFIYPHIFYTLYSYDDANINLLFDSNGSISYYSFINNNNSKNNNSKNNKVQYYISDVKFIK